MLPSKAALNNDTRFLKSTPETTLTIPSTARKIISAGAYDFHTRAYADFSGRGFTRQTNQIKPDVVAPGVNIITAGNRGGYEAVTGTSFATAPRYRSGSTFDAMGDHQRKRSVSIR